MESPWPASLRDRFAENLTCLKDSQPEVAAFIENATIPDSVLLLTGRDGQPTFQLSSNDQTIEWLGASSMPSVSAPQILSHLETTDVNAIIPGIVTGLEPLVLLEKLPLSSAVFVVEPNPLLIKLAFHLYDYTAHMRTGRLIVVTTDGWVDQFCAFFETHPGYEFPTQMITVPLCTSHKFALVQQQVERAGQTIFAFHSQQLMRIKASLDAATPPNLQTPRMAVIAVDSRPCVLEELDHIVRAAEQLSWPVVSCRGDVPSQRHPIQRLRCVQQVNANIVIAVGGWSQTFGQLLPASASVICWLTSSSAVPNVDATDLARIDLVVAPTTRLKRHIETWPIKYDSLRVCPAAIDEPEIEQPTPPTIAADDSVDVAIVADLPDDRPASFGISLPSQLRLWQAMRDVACDQIKTKVELASPEEMLVIALKHSGIHLKEKAISQQFAIWLEHQILPARRAIATAEALQQAGIKFALYGWGWSELSDGHFQSVQASCLTATRERASASAKAVVIPLAHDVELQFLIECLSQAKPVICHGSAASFSQDYPELSSVTGFVDFYRGMDELVSAACTAICPNPLATRRYADAQSQVMREHTWPLRLLIVARSLLMKKQTPVSAGSSVPA